MKLLMTADTVGGVWTYALDLAKALALYDVEVALATMGSPVATEQQCELRRLENVELFESDFKLEWMDDPWSDVAAAGEWLLQLESETRPDIVHLNGYVHGALPWSTPVLVVGHSCVLSWWQAVKGQSAPEHWGTYRREVQRGLQAAHLVVAPTQAMLNQLHGLYGSFARTMVIPNGRNAELFAPGPKEPYMFSAGRLWDEAKNLRTLAAAADGLPWPVRVAGNIDKPGDAAAASAPPQVEMLGRLDSSQLRAELGRASIYALPARYEPFGLSVLEAALSGCALVLGDIPSLREVWGDSAVFVAPDDAAALRRALGTLIDDPAQLRRMSQLARRRAARYSLQRLGGAYREAYTTVSATAPVVLAA